MKTKRNSFKNSYSVKIGFSSVLIIPIFTAIYLPAISKENIGNMPKQQSQSQLTIQNLATTCSQSGSRIDLDVNNVRTKILGGGDMWWDLKDVKYEIPKDSKKHSLFAGSLWIGGMAQSNLKVAAMTYRQTGNDFWSGPLDKSNASVDATVCAQYDRHYTITRKEVIDFATNWNSGKAVPDAINNWPAFDLYNNSNITQPLAPFVDNDLNGEYNPIDGGDYPGYSLHGEMGNCKTEAQLFGDRTLWWVFNDKGNIHTESDGSQIGIEIHAQAFAFQTNDEINNMTFYQYQIFNRSSDQLDSCYLGMWVDPDLGNPNDDFIGCDVGRGLGYCYNGDADDDGNGENHYGLNPPAVGVDFFQGPLADADGIDNPASETYNGTGYGDVIIDNERLGMEKFMFYRNDFSMEGNPTQTIHYYNYLKGKWKDNNPITYGGTGHLSSSTFCNFMYPGDSDPNNSTPWFQTGTSYDGRFIHSAGPFTLLPGAINIVTVGAVWARTNSGGPMESVNLLKAADDKAQRLFDNCFQVLNGPDAPDLTIRELDRELILYLSNKINSNNYNDTYKEIDPNIVSPPGLNPRYDSIYRFQGYQLFQLKNASVTIADIHNPDLAREIAQCDVKDGVTQLINFKYDQAINGNVPVQEVYGADNGIQKSFRVLSDEFAIGDKRLVNNKSYYFLALAYAYNNYKTYNQQNPQSFDGQKLPYKPGRNNIGMNGMPYVGIPHLFAVENNGTVQHSQYGQELSLIRIEGQGNGGHVLDLTTASVDALLNDSNFVKVEYEAGKSPASVKIVDPLRVPASDFNLCIFPSNSFSHSIDSAQWTLTNIKTGEKINSETSIAVKSERLTEWGLSVTIEQCLNAGDSTSLSNGFLESTITFSDKNKKWLSGVPDLDGPFPINWIRSGSAKTAPYPTGDPLTDDYNKLDKEQFYEGLISQNIGYGSGGTWAPYRLCSQETGGGSGPAWKNFNVSSFYQNPLQNNALNQLGNLASVDIVFTADKSKWTRCPVFELCDNELTAAGNARKFDLRKKASVDKDGLTDNSGTIGMSWFPGYAINIETGERLNMAFGEDSHFNGAQNDTDLIWNPTSNLGFTGIFSTTPDPIFGGKHYVYVFGHNTSKFANPFVGDTNNVPAYDNGNFVYNKLKYRGSNMEIPKDALKKDVFKDIIWCGIPLLANNHRLLECDVKIRLRVTKPFQNNYAANGFNQSNGLMNLDGPRANPAYNNNYPMYNFSTYLYACENYNETTAKNALQLINVVPNPYYGFSSYEMNQADNQIMITNLPKKCTIKIYTLNGTLVREFKKDELRTSLNWDLKNQVGIPIASGAYLIHIDAPTIGEKVVKWFGALRPTDLDSY